MHFDGHLKGLGCVPGALTASLRDQLRREIEHEPRLWEVANAEKPNRYGSVTEPTDHIVFQFPVTTLGEAPHKQSRYYARWEGWEATIAPIIAVATSSYGYSRGRTSRIMLARLRPGRTIERHIDAGISCEVPHKLHVPLVTHPAVEFWIGNETYHLDLDHVYEVNNCISHGGRNASDVDRIHLIFDYFEDSPE
jgi:hypothetical protein